MLHLLRKTLSHLCGAGLWKKQKFKEAVSQRSFGTWPGAPEVQPGQAAGTAQNPALPVTHLRSEPSMALSLLPRGKRPPREARQSLVPGALCTTQTSGPRLGPQASEDQGPSCRLHRSEARADRLSQLLWDYGS